MNSWSIINNHNTRTLVYRSHNTLSLNLKNRA